MNEMNFKNRGEQVFETLKREILDLKLEPGRMISENEICERFGVSRTPVRDALWLLQEQGFVETVVNQIVDSEAADMDAFMAEAWAADTTKTVKDALVEKIAVIGENLNIRRFEKVAADNGCVVSYIHGGGRIGVLVVADTDVVNDDIKACLKNVAMQVAAMSPKYVSRDEVSQEYMEHEKEILLAQAKKENPEKPENIIEKMIIGRLNKEMKEICLLDQVYVQDSDLTVAKYVDKVAKENNANVTVKKFVRFETGEGLEKKVDDFAAEVAAQAGM